LSGLDSFFDPALHNDLLSFCLRARESFCVVLLLWLFFDACCAALVADAVTVASTAILTEFIPIQRCHSALGAISRDTGALSWLDDVSCFGHSLC
jgi:hypothetical protein